MAAAGQKEGAREAWIEALAILHEHANDRGVRSEACAALAGLARLEAADDPNSALSRLTILADIGSPVRQTEAWIARADILAGMERWEERLTALRRVLGDSPEEADNEDLRFQVGQTLDRLGRRDDAVSAWDRIRTVASPWTDRARESAGSQGARTGDLRILASHYPAEAVLRTRRSITGRVGAIVQQDGTPTIWWGSKGYRFVEDRLDPIEGEGEAPPVLVELRERRFRAEIDFGGYRFVAPERFNRGAVLLGETSLDGEAEGRPARLLTYLLGGYGLEKWDVEFFGGEIVAIGKEGELLWRLEIPEPIAPVLTVSDRNGPDRPVVVVVDEGKGQVRYLDARGEVERSIETARVGLVRTVPAPGGGSDLAVSTSEGLRIFDSRGEQRWISSRSSASIAPGDLDGDGVPEVFVVGGEPGLEVRRLDGSIENRVEGFGVASVVEVVLDREGPVRILVGAGGLHVIGFE